MFGLTAKIAKALALGISLVALGAATADAGGRQHGSYKDSGHGAYGGQNYWTGPYIGMAVGVRGTDIDWKTQTVTLDATGLQHPRFPDSKVDRDLGSDGLEFRGYVGYNLQAGGIVFGIEGGLTGGGESNAKTEQVFPGANNLFLGTAPNTFDAIKAGTGLGGHVRGRLGVLLRPDLLFFGSAGWAMQNFGFNADCQGSTLQPSSSLCWQLNKRDQSIRASGWTFGTGFEAKLFANWFARIEYTYSGFGSEDLTFKFADDTNCGGAGGNCSTTMKARVDLDIQTLNVGVGYRF